MWGNINKRIQNLHTSIQSRELRSDFTSALQGYVPEADIRVEFPGPGAKLRLGRYGDEAPSFATVWRDLVKTITDETSHGLNAEDPLYSTSYYAALFVHADALEHSRFLKTLLDDYSPLNMVRKERIERLKRR